VIAPAKTGNESSNKIAVRNTDQINKGRSSNINPFLRMFTIVVIKFADPKIELTPAKCKEKIPRSTDAPGCPVVEDNGGYTVHPVPAPDSTIPDLKSNIRAGGKNQNLILFIRGKAISGAVNINGINQFPNPPIIVGITKKKIIIKA
jgi:hypothetical protein